VGCYVDFRARDMCCASVLATHKIQLQPPHKSIFYVPTCFAYVL